MLKYFIVFVLTLCLIQSHALCATEANNTIKDIKDKESIESEKRKMDGN